MRLLLSVPLAALLLALSTPARALDAVVTNCGSDADFFAKLGAVRTAGSGSIKFSCGASPAEITLTQTAVITFGPLLIDGGNKITLSGGNARALFLVGQSRSLVLKRLVIANAASGTGAIQVFENARVKSTAVTFEDNHSTTSGGALYALSGATLKVKRCTFSGNSADSSGGSIAAFSANVNVLLSTFADDSAALYHNLGRGLFRDVSVATGVRDPTFKPLKAVTSLSVSVAPAFLTPASIDLMAE